MWWKIILILLFVFVCCFGFVLFSGAPYLPTLNKQVKAALKLAKLKKGATILELGCGDGRVLISAAQQGLNAVGYELNPVMFLIAWYRTRPYRQHVKVIFGNFWHKKWPTADAIYVFLLPRLMDKLDQKITKQTNSYIVISFAFKFPKRTPVAEEDGVMRYDFNH